MCVCVCVSACVRESEQFTKLLSGPEPKYLRIVQRLGGEPTSGTCRNKVWTQLSTPKSVAFLNMKTSSCPRRRLHRPPPPRLSSSTTSTAILVSLGCPLVFFTSPSSVVLSRLFLRPPTVHCAVWRGSGPFQSWPHASSCNLVKMFPEEWTATNARNT